MKTLSSCISFCLIAHLLLAQSSSQNGAEITQEGDYRVLVICVDINWTTDQLEFIQQQLGYSGWTSTSGNWQQGLTYPPTFIQNLFDVDWNGGGTNEFTKYFDQMSHGKYRMTGDVFSEVVQVDGDSLPINWWDYTAIGREACKAAYADSVFQTIGGLDISDFDSWAATDSTGSLKINSSNDSVDNIVFVYRNIGPFLTGGAARQSSNILLLDIFEDTTYSFFDYGVDNHTHFGYLGLDIFKHEYGHHLLGGLHFHAAGGHDRVQDSYFIASQCGWGIMGSGGASLKTINAWERRRLGWRAPGRTMDISCLNGGTEISTDLDATDPNDEDTYVLGDFVTTGDAMRIKLPFIPGSEFQQWLWIENHQGVSEFDTYDYRSCQDPFQPGLYMYIQIDKDSLIGSETFEGFADYIKPLPASGMFDVELGPIHDYDCGTGQESRHVQKIGASNPLSGYSDLQQTNHDFNEDGQLLFVEREGIHVEDQGGIPIPNWAWRGHTRHAFHNGTGGNKKIGIATNPSSASHITLVSGDSALVLDSVSLQNNRSIYLNGVMVEITGYNAGTGEMTVKVEFDQVNIDEDTRWCGDDIVLPNMAAVYPDLSTAGWSLMLAANKTLDIDRNKMPSRIIDVDTFVPASGPTEYLFNDATTFRMAPNAKMKAFEGSEINVNNGSSLILATGNELDIENGTLNILNGSTLVLNSGSLLDLSGSGGLVYIDPTSTLIIRGSADIHLEGYDSELEIDGTVIVEEGGSFSFSGLGFITYNGTMVNDSTATWDLRGEDIDDVLIVLYSSLYWEGGIVDIAIGTIQFVGDNLEIEIDGCDDVSVNTIRFTSNAFGNTFEDNTALALNASNLVCTSSEFLDFYHGILISDRSDTAIIDDCLFQSNVFPIEVSQLGGVVLTNSDLESVGNLPSGPISYYNTGLKVSNTPFVQMDMTDIVSGVYGVELDSVEGFYMRGGTIDSCDFGIRSTESLVFLRNGATIQNSLEFGVHMMGTDPLNSMITMGDSGCANVILNDVGISGMGTTINIDAYIHAENSGTPSFVQFNRLDQNPYNYVEMCYHDTAGVFIPDTIHMKGVYFGSSAPSSSHFETYKSTDFYPQSWSCGTTTTNIADDYSQHSTCTPMGICDCFIGTPPSGNGSFGGVANKADFSIIDTIRYRVQFDPNTTEKLNLSKLILASYTQANQSFVMMDTKASRSRYIPLASIGLVRVAGEWLALSIRDRMYALDEASIHRIVVAKVLTNYPLGPVIDSPDIFKEYDDWLKKQIDQPTFKIYPNPTRDQVNIDISGQDEEFGYAIISNLGTTVLKGSIATGSNVITLRNLGAGVYYLRINGIGHVYTQKIVKSAD